MGQLADAIKAETKDGRGCSVPRFAASLGKDLSKDFLAALDQDVSASAIVRALGKLGHSIGASTLRRHRRGECDCGRAR